MVACGWALLAALSTGCGSVEGNGGDSDADSDTDSDADSDTDSDSDTEPQYCTDYAVARNADCLTPYGVALGACLCSSCVLRNSFAGSFFTCASDLPCEGDSGIADCYEGALGQSPPEKEATAYESECIARLDACEGDFLDGWGEDPDRFKCEGAIGMREALAAALRPCLDENCRDVKSCADGAILALCPDCAP